MMVAPNYQLALILKRRQPSRNQHDAFELVVTPSPPPSTIPGGSTTGDLQLFDLPFASLSITSSTPPCPSSLKPIVEHVSCALETIVPLGFDVVSAVSQLKIDFPSGWETMQPWTYWKMFDEPHYGPGPSLSTIFFMTELELSEDSLAGAAKFLSSEAAWKLLTGGIKGEMRLGPLVAYAFMPHFPQGLLYRLKLKVAGQEYPPGVLQIPMASVTREPFSKTNLVIFAAGNNLKAGSSCDVIARGEALLVDPGCHPRDAKGQLASVVTSLSQCLLVFLTHHHLDHIEGLQTIQKHNPQTLVLGHELTIDRLGKAGRNMKYLSVHDGSVIVVGDQELKVIAAPGHTDGHMALLHVSTHTLIVGDHCVGYGSSVLDASSGGNMHDYLTTTRRLLDLAPRVIVPMHGHFNLWPIHMLASYIRHREARETKILSFIEQGAQTAYNIVSSVYADTPPSLWMAALSNVKLHVDHLNESQKLPQHFSMATFKNSCGLRFYYRCVPKVLSHSLLKMLKAKGHKSLLWKGSAGLILSSFLYLWQKNNFRKLVFR